MAALQGVARAMAEAFFRLATDLDYRAVMFNLVCHPASLPQPCLLRLATGVRDQHSFPRPVALARYAGTCHVMLVILASSLTS